MLSFAKVFYAEKRCRKEFSKAAGLPEQRDRMKVLYADKSAYVPTSGLKKATKSGIIKSNGEATDAGRYTSIDGKWNIDPADKEKIYDTVEHFASSFSNVEKEHSIVITKSGEVFSLTGTSVTVDPSVVGAEKLSGSIGAHNHPVPDGETMGDSFSRADLIFSAKYKTGIEYRELRYLLGKAGFKQH